ncbi:hypothetical protein K1719_046369 [Acacia pycnantha]|nr:hypothetical protein K1719_046369 [Acacia pycnantha]
MFRRAITLLNAKWEEENDILYRNAKKIKSDEEKLHGEEWPMLGTERVYQKAPGTSFVEKLKGQASERMMEDPYEGLHWLHLGYGLYVHKIEDYQSCCYKDGLGVARLEGESADLLRSDASILGKDLDIAEEWRVVNRPRLRGKRPSKESKQGDVRRKEEGSRFGVLAEENIGGMEELIVTDQVVVRGVAVGSTPQGILRR